jgi:hypothetical protein
MPHKRSEPYLVLGRTLQDTVANRPDAASVRPYVCAVISRALSRERLVRDCCDADKVGLEERQHLKAEVEINPASYDYEEMLNDDREEDEPEDWIVFEGDLNVVSECGTFADEQSNSNPDVRSASSPASGSSFGKLFRGKERFAGAVKKKVASVGGVGDKIVGTVGRMGDLCTLNSVNYSIDYMAGMWDAADEAGEKYLLQMEDIVKLKAGAISDMSKTGVDKSRAVCQDVESRLINSGAVEYMQRLEGCLQNGAVLMSSKANTLSKAAGVQSGPKLPSYTGMRRSLKSVVNKGVSAVQKGPFKTAEPST